MGRFAPRQHQRTTAFRTRSRSGMLTARFYLRVFPLVLLILTLACTSYIATMMTTPVFAQTTQDAEQNQNNDDKNLFGQPDNGDNLFGEPDNGGFLQELDNENNNSKQPKPNELTYPAGNENAGLVPLELKGVTVASLAMQIAEWSGKPVWIDPKVADQKITLVTGKAVTEKEAYDLLAIAVFEQKLAMVDRSSYIAIISLSDIPNGDAPIIGPDEDVLKRTDRGMIAVKIYQLRYGKASDIVDAFRRDGELISAQYAKIGFDDASNQIIVMYNIGTLQRIQRIIDALDVEGTPLTIKTFYLKHRDAETTAQLIIDLFSADEENGDSGNIFGAPRGRQTSRRGNTLQLNTPGVATTSKLRVTFDKRANSITVRAEKEVLDQITDRLKNEWDVPLRNEPPMRSYDLVNSDVVKVRDMLREMFSPADESVGSLGVADFFGQSRGGGGNRGRGSSSNNTEGITGLHPYAGAFSFEADENKNRLFVTARSAEFLDYMDKLLAQIDQPSDVNKPIIIELKYANAERLAEQLNAIFAQTGQGSGISGSEEGLTAGSSGSPFDNNAAGGGAGGGAAGGQDGAPNAQDIQFWWQTGRPSEDERPISGLISQMRIVPITRRNALLILARPQHRADIKDIVDQLDKPGRQVLILATIAAASDEAVKELGLRWGSSSSIIDASTPDNQINIQGDIANTKNNLIPSLFDTSVLNLNLNLTAVLSLLQQDSDSTILSSPRVFTSDNQEAVFFDGQDIPFISQSAFTDTGQQNQSFNYRAVGIRLATRPHITVEGNVDMHINLELSSIVPGQTLFGGFIIDRRETSSRVTVRNGQTIVISGILRTEESDIIRKIPFLGDIPIIGNIFFRNRDKSMKHSELITFVTPIILENPENGNEMFKNRLDWLKQKFPNDADKVVGPDAGGTSDAEGTNPVTDQNNK